HPGHVGVWTHGYAPAVVDDGDRVVDVDRGVYLAAVSGQRLVDGVVDDLVDEVVQPALSGRADVHGGADAHRLQALEHADRARAVLGRLRIGRPCVVAHESFKILRGGAAGRPA